MYTREEVLAMPAGREMDAMVAEQVMGYEVGGDVVESEFPEDMPGDFMFVETPRGRKKLKHYSTDIAAAWEVVEKMDSEVTVKRYETISLGYRYWCRISKGSAAPYLETVEQGETAPLAICRAALLSLLKED